MALRPVLAGLGFAGHGDPQVVFFAGVVERGTDHFAGVVDIIRVAVELDFVVDVHDQVARHFRRTQALDSCRCPLLTDDASAALDQVVECLELSGAGDPSLVECPEA